MEEGIRGYRSEWAGRAEKGVSGAAWECRVARSSRSRGSGSGERERGKKKKKDWNNVKGVFERHV